MYGWNDKVCHITFPVWSFGGFDHKVSTSPKCVIKGEKQNRILSNLFEL